MPPQSVEVAETIVALKKALRREKDAPSDQPISSATNRGNKLKRGAGYVSAGSMPYRSAPNGFTEKVEHAGFTRYILSRNPRRFNEYGDELEGSESDQEADIDAEDSNPYSDIRLEELLRPLTHPAELEHHPTLGRPYLDSALPDMVQTTEEKLRQERANLWRAKNLHRHFIGDESWIPCENVETPDDWDLFEPAPPESIGPSPGQKRKRLNDYDMARNHVEEQDHADPSGAEVLVLTDTAMANGQLESVDEQDPLQEQLHENPGMNEEDNNALDQRDGSVERSGDIDMVDGEDTKQNGLHEEADTVEHDPQLSETVTNRQPETDPEAPVDIPEANEAQSLTETAEDTPPPPARRITRALAANNTSSAPTPPLSPTTSTISSVSNSLLQPAPIFLLPSSLSTAHSTHPSTLPLYVAHSGLPLDEILETRRLLGMYIQKQEETIRGLEGVLGKLIKAKRMKERVWEWSKTEGHVGERSDGEDWIDTEAWGVQAGELRKGRDEEEAAAAALGEEEQVGRKGKRRRGRE